MIRPEYADEPMYHTHSKLRMRTLDDYLRVAALQWAAQHDLQIPLSEDRTGIEIELETFKEWLLGDTSMLRVIQGGKSDTTA